MISFEHKTISNTFSVCNAKFDKLYNWTLCNKLTINTDTTFYMIITNRIHAVGLPQIVLNNRILQCKSEEKFLCVILDNKLKFNPHMKSISSKLSKTIGVIHRIKSCLFSLYYSLYISVLIILQLNLESNLSL